MSTETQNGISAAATAVVRSLPIADVNPGQPLEGAAGLDQAIVAAGSKAVSASLAGAFNGTLVLVLTPEAATEVENGPVGAQDLAAALEPALTDATSGLASTLGEIRHEAALVLDAEVAIANAASAEVIHVVPFATAAAQVGALVVFGTLSTGPPAEESAAFEALSNTLTGNEGSLRSVELLKDVEMGVTAELGRTRMTVRELLGLQPGSIVELDRAAGSPVDLLVNGTLVARGEVVVIDEEFGVRITEIIGYDAKKQNPGQD